MEEWGLLQRVAMRFWEGSEVHSSHKRKVKREFTEMRFLKASHLGLSEGKGNKISK
jgi:hypothetical protein